MKINSKKAAAVAIAAIMTCGVFAGCDLVIQNENENMKQTVAEVNIKTSGTFQSEFGDLNEELVSKVIDTATVSKRDMIVSFVGSGYNAMNSYGWTYKDTFDAISESLVQRQVYIQYAKAYFLKNGWTDKNNNDEKYTYDDLAKFNDAVNDKTGILYDIAATEHFLTDEEINKAEYTTRVMFNNSIDSLEEQYIEEKKDNKEYDSEVRTTPTGLNTSNSDYYDEDYRIYTGTGAQSGVHVYEPKEGSTSTTRLRGYNDLLERLKSNGLVKDGEDTSNIESLEYFLLEKKADLEDALIQKMTDTFTQDAENKIKPKDVNAYFTEMLENQSKIYQKSSSTLESDLDSVSNTNFVLTSARDQSEPEQPDFGFVINILLPFSAAQSDELSAVKQDYGDKKGNKFATRAKLLEKVKATDQRGSWFRGETDYSFKATSATGAYGYNTDTAKPREWLFFEDNLNEELSEYERLKNYYGQYTYNGKWDEKSRKYKPYQINIDTFITEMEGYLSDNDLTPTVTKSAPADYFNTTSSSYYYTADQDGHKKGDVDYSKFVYRQGYIFGKDEFDPNQMFKADTKENKALSIINELSFAYNTDTAGLNKYLGYAITANKTDFVNEFEYAAQEVVKKGAGNYMIVPSDYGWHIIYCTFSFVDAAHGTEGKNTPFKYVDDDKTKEGTFSYLFYENYKSDTASKESTRRRSKIISSFKDSYTIYEDRYSDLSNLDNKN